MTKEQFESQVLALADTMYRVSCSLLRRPQDRHDAMQSCLLRAWEHRNRLRDESRFRAWLLRILVNECHTLLRRGMRLVLTDAPEATQEDALPDRFLRDAIEALPVPLRLPVVLHYVEGLTTVEVGRVLGIPPGTVKSRLSRARTQLKQTIGEEV